jgi:hypothetical protein
MPAFEVAMVLPPKIRKLIKRLMVIDTCNQQKSDTVAICTGKSLIVWNTKSRP